MQPPSAPPLTRLRHAPDTTTDTAFYLVAAGMSYNPAAQRAAMQLDEAARRCAEAADYLAQASPKARSWAEATTLRGTGDTANPHLTASRDKGAADMGWWEQRRRSCVGSSSS